MKVVTFMLFDPLLIVTVDVGRVIAYVKDAAPATSKLAAATVPVVAGRVTPPPPPVVRLPVGSRITVPPVVADTATLPKFRSIVLVMEIGVMIVAEADAVAVACANELVLNPIITAAASTTFLILCYSGDPDLILVDGLVCFGWLTKCEWFKPVWLKLI